MQRRTAQRDQIQQTFEKAGRPLGVDEVHAAASRSLPRLGVATVYRAINDLVEAGWLKPVELPGEPTRYELAGLDHHHHFRCTGCDRVFDIDGCALGHQPHLPPGFRVDTHEVIFYGRCADCAKTK
jgi:Fur family ferric uptake transcriptional regulator